MKRIKDCIRRATTELPYIIIPNHMLGSLTLSFEAKGLLSFILSLPRDWVVNKAWLLKEFPINRRAIDRIFKELDDMGYLTSFDIVGPPGKFSGKGYIFYPKSIKDIPESDYVMSDAQNELRKLGSTKKSKQYRGSVVRFATSSNEQLPITKETNYKVKQSNELDIKRAQERATQEELFRRFAQADARFGVPTLPSDEE